MLLGKISSIIMTVIMWIMDIETLRNVYQMVSKPIRRNFRGITRNTKKTFKKLFGVKRVLREREMSSRNIMDKILSE